VVAAQIGGLDTCSRAARSLDDSAVVLTWLIQSRGSHDGAARKLQWLFHRRSGRSPIHTNITDSTKIHVLNFFRHVSSDSRRSYGSRMILNGGQDTVLAPDLQIFHMRRSRPTGGRQTWESRTGRRRSECQAWLKFQENLTWDHEGSGPSSTPRWEQRRGTRSSS
jgi:hypothetical protein